MKTLLISVLFAVALTVTPANLEEEARERRQTEVECQERIQQNMNSLTNAITQIRLHCDGTSCSHSCWFALTTINNNIGCCLGRYNGNTFDIYAAYRLCLRSRPSPCSSSSTNLASVAAIILFSIVSYLVN